MYEPDIHIRKEVPDSVPVSAQSVVLFRLGEACNNACPFCSNSGRPEAAFVSGHELLARVDRLAALGVRRVVVTGGEPTIHPAFWEVVARLQARGMRWDLNTHGRNFSDPAFARRAVDAGLRRAIISLHHHDPVISARLFGAKETAHHETVAGIARALEAGVMVMVNCVVTKANSRELSAFIDDCVARFATAGRFAVKLAFPSTSGKGGRWAGIQLRYEEVRESVREVDSSRDRWPVPVYFEGFPSCVIGRAEIVPMSRTGFGETHYLEDIEGRTLYAMDRVEAELAVFAPRCRACPAMSRCSGVATGYASRYGLAQLTPFEAAPATAVEGDP